MSSTVEESQRSAARLAGAMYLITIAVWAFAFYVRAGLIVNGSATETVSNILADERLFRMSIASDLVMGAGVMVLVVALWVLLRPVNESIAFLAVVWRLVDPVLCVVTVSSFPVLFLSSGAEYLRGIEVKQIEAFAMLAIWLYGAGFIVSAVFLGLGSAAFSYLLYKSRYVPKTLAAFGVFSSLLAVMCALMTIVFPGFATIATVGLMPLLIYEIGLGLWLLLKGARIPPSPAYAV